MDDGGPCLVDITDGKFRLDSTALARVLCQPPIEDKPLAVVGIAGAMRTGKSFALTFLMRYLRKKGWRNPHWIGDDETCADDGIGWKGGKKPDTRGICVWSEIFLVEKENGDELAVLLVDTQGLFDREMTREQNLRLLTFTVLFCSRTLLNIRGEINEQDLGHLQFFTQYANTVSKSKDKIPFQDLIFLVRDWQNPEDDPYGLDGGESYLREIFEQTGENEVDCVRRDLRSAFGSIKSFLMPHPGNKVKKADFEGRNSDLDPEFLTYIKELAGAVFDPKSLTERVHNGRRMTGRHLWSLLDACNQAFDDGDAPEVKNMVEGFARMTNRLACEDGLKIFVEKFDEKAECADKDATHREAQEAALQYFEENTKFGDENFRQEYRTLLISRCQNHYKRLSTWDKYRELRARNFSAQKLHEMWTKYKDSMKVGLEYQYKSAEEIEKLHSKHSEAALVEFQKETSKEASFHEQHHELLNGIIAHSRRKLDAVNEERHMLQTLGSMAQAGDMKPEYEAYLRFHEIAQQYREEIEKFTGIYVEEKNLNDQIERLQGSYYDRFSDMWDREGPNINDYRENLVKLLKEEWKDCLEQNERNKMVFDSGIEECVMTTTVKYQEEMHQVLERSHCKPSDLQKAHDCVSSKLTGELENAVGVLEDSYKEKVVADARAELSTKFVEFQETNANNRLDKPRMDWEGIEKIMKDAVGAMTVVTLGIRRFTTFLNTVKSVHATVKPLLGAQILPAGLSTAVPYIALGVAAAVTVAVVAYCVYTHYKV